MSKEINVVSKSLYWAFIEKALQFILSFFVTTILAREIGPSAFGLVALAIVFEFLFLYLMESGLSQVIIQKKEINPNEINTAFTLNVLLGAVFTLFFFLSANLISEFFNQAQLSDIIKIMSLKIFLISFSRIHVALLEKYYKFKTLALISAPVRLFSGSLAVFLVYSGFGFWSYIYYSLVQAALLSAALFSFSGYKVKLHLSNECLKRLLPLGIQFSATRLLNTLSEKIYYIVIGKYYDISTLGLYQRADVIRRSSSEEFSTIINRVFFPFFSSKCNTVFEFFETYKKVAPFYSLFFFLTSAIIISLSDSLIYILLGEEWEQSSAFLKFLSVLGFINALNLFLAMIRKSTGSGKVLLNETIFERVIRLVLLFSLIKHGLIVVICGQIIGSLFAFLLRIFSLKSFLKISYFQTFKPFSPGLILLIMILSLYGLNYFYFYEYINLLQTRMIFIMFSIVSAYLVSYFFYRSQFNYFSRNIFFKK